jgi:DNA polymerase III subunit alpha
MTHADFVHLRLHTAYSLSEGAIQIKTLIPLCERGHMPAIAVTDTGNLFGALEFSEAAAAVGIQPIIGCALAVRTVAPDGDGGSILDAPPRMVFLAQNEIGYRNLLQLSSRAYLETDGGDTPHVTMAMMREYGDGLIVLSGGADGPVGRMLQEGQSAAGRLLMEQLAGIYPGRLYVELQRHGLPSEEQTEPEFLDIAYALDLPIVATNDVLFEHEGFYVAQDALTCVADGSYVAQQDRRRVTREHRFKSAKEMRVLFADLPEAISNTLVIAQRCSYRPTPHDPILPRFSEDESEELVRLSEEGLAKRLEDHVYTEGMSSEERNTVAQPYKDRLSFELDVIIKMQFPGYFLIVADFIQWSKANDIPVGPGRGSGAGSVVAWALTITDLNPLQFGLLFERFLNPERVSMPDFDIDFCQEKRDQVIRYVQQKYGDDRVAQIITFGTFQARAVLRDVGRVLEMPYPQVDRLCKMIPNNPANPTKLGEAIEGEPRLKQAKKEDDRVAQLLNIGLKLEGLYRHASTHAAGVVIGDRPLSQLIPLYRDPRSETPVTQFSMKWAEKAGLVKFDFLGLKTLTVLDRACQLVRARGDEVDLSKLPLDDVASYELLLRGETVGVFQLESTGMRDMLKRLKADCFEDIIAMVALYRPGPMDNIPRYIACKHGLETPDYLHPTLEPILKETYGVIIYQEQVMQIAQVLSGYSLGDADLLRRAMGKKIKAEMDAQQERFVSGAVENGVDGDQAASIFELVAKFAGYGFNKSHAAAYALVAYQTAWLKANYPVEFMAASMTLDLGNTDKLKVFKDELRRAEIPLLLPDVNKSGVEFGVETVTLEDGSEAGAIRYALAAIKNVGAQAMVGLVAERSRGGVFRSLDDLAQRMDARLVNKKQIENLTRAGGFDSMNRNRHQVFESAELLTRSAAAAAEEREVGQGNLLGGGDDHEGAGLELPNVQPWTPDQELDAEAGALGFYLSAHPIDSYPARDLERLRVVQATTFIQHAQNGATHGTLAGVVEAVRERVSQRGKRYAFIELSDPSGAFEVMVFSDQLEMARDLLVSKTALLIMVEAKCEDGDVRLSAKAIRLLESAAADTDTGLRVFIDTHESLAPLKTLLETRGNGKSLVSLVMQTEDRHREVEMTVPGTFSISPPVRNAIKGLPGVLEVQEV